MAESLNDICLQANLFRFKEFVSKGYEYNGFIYSSSWQ